MTYSRKLHMMLFFMAAAMTVMEAQKSTSGTTPVTQQVLQQVAASLQMYVDPLPQMPTIYGYSMRSGEPFSVNLTIGMYQTKWVIFYILSFFIIHVLLSIINTKQE